MFNSLKFSTITGIHYVKLKKLEADGVIVPTLSDSGRPLYTLEHVQRAIELKEAEIGSEIQQLQSLINKKQLELENYKSRVDLMLQSINL